MMAKKPHVPPVIKRDATTSTWRRNVLISVALLLACVLAANTFLGQRSGVAQTTPPGGSYGLGAYGGEGYDSGYGEEYRSDYGDEMGYGGGYGNEMGYGAGSSMMAGAGPRQELEARVAPLVNRLRNAKDDDQKKAIQSELSGILENYFEQDLRRRSAEIASIEERVQRLKDQCEQRKQAKDEILQLQMKVLENQAAGLGFFGQAGAGQETDTGMGSFMGAAMGEMVGMEGGDPDTGDAEHGVDEYGIIPKDLAARGGQLGIVSTSGAEEIAIREAAVDSTAARLKIVEAAFADGRATALELAEARGEFEIATKRLERAKRENAAQDRLLELELQRAELELAAVQGSLDESTAINLKSPGTIPSSEIKKAELAVRTAELDVERIQTLLELHREPAGDDSPE